MKIGMRQWRDCAPLGGLYTILKRCLLFKVKKQLRRFDFQSEQRREEVHAKPNPGTPLPFARTFEPLPTRCL